MFDRVLNTVLKLVEQCINFFQKEIKDTRVGKITSFWCLVFDHFVGLALIALSVNLYKWYTDFIYFLDTCASETSR